MRILIINDCGISGGGAEIRIRLLIESLLRTKFFDQIHLLEHETSNSKIDGVFVQHCNAKNSGFVTDEIIKNHCIDIVQVHNLAAISTKPIIAAKKNSKPVIFCVHDYWPFCGRRDMYSKQNKVCDCAYFSKCIKCIGLKSYLHILRTRGHLNLCNFGIAPSKFTIAMYEKHNILNGKWVQVSPWIDSQVFNYSRVKHIRKNKNLLLFVGPLSRSKGAYLIVEALRRVKESIPDIKLRFIGGGQEPGSRDRVKMEEFLIENDLFGNVEFSGSRTANELAVEYAKASVYICCPLWPEVFGQTWAQAQACGAKVVVTRVGSIPELCSNNCVEPNTEAIAESVIQAINSKSSAAPQQYPLDIGKILSIYSALKLCEEKIID